MEDLGRQSILGRTGGEAPAFEPAPQKYEVETLLGTGGMGEVYLVSDRDLRRRVAMKVLRPEVAEDAEFRTQLVAEAQATSQLDHPGIPPVYDIGISAQDRLYFTMKVIAGRTLRDILQDLAARKPDVEKEFTLHRLVSLLERILEPLHFGHEKGVIHRDLKPENVMLGEFGEVHVVDWGLARVRGKAKERRPVETTRSASGTTTVFGTIRGTPLYMSPEQMQGETETLDRRTDVYAASCLLYEMLTLHPVVEARVQSYASRPAQGLLVAQEVAEPGTLREAQAQDAHEEQEGHQHQAQGQHHLPGPNHEGLESRARHAAPTAGCTVPCGAGTSIRMGLAAERQYAFCYLCICLHDRI